MARTQVTRSFTNSSFNAVAVDKLLNLNLSQVKHVASRALAFCNVTTNRSVSSVVSGKGDRGFTINTHNESAGQKYLILMLYLLYLINKHTDGISVIHRGVVLG